MPRSGDRDATKLVTYSTDDLFALRGTTLRRIDKVIKPVLVERRNIGGYPSAFDPRDSRKKPRLLYFGESE
jgi:hypothetical protein